MKEFAKSLCSYSLAMTLFGLKQVDNLLTLPPDGERKPLVIKSLNSLTSATAAQFGETLKSTFDAVDNIQRGLIELTFSMMGSRTSRTGRKAVLVSVEPQKWTEVLVVDPPSARDVEMSESYRQLHLQ